MAWSAVMQAAQALSSAGFCSGFSLTSFLSFAANSAALRETVFIAFVGTTSYSDPGLTQYPPSLRSKCFRRL